MLLYLIISIISSTLINADDIDILSNLLGSYSEPISYSDLYLMEDKLEAQQVQKVDVKLYYECLCPDCRNFDTAQLVPTMEKLSQYIDLHLYPYGNAKTIINNGKYKFKCQHGPEECYGNKLHACAIDQLGNVTKAVIFNSCLMDSSQPNRGSNDAAADKCGTELHINSEAIKQCAKGAKGTELLKYYGDESKKANFKYVPYILINGVLNDGNNFMRDVCAAFATPPPPCSQSSSDRLLFKLLLDELNI